MKCQETKQKIYSLIDGELAAQEERNLYGHLSTCSSCMTEYNLARDLNDLLEHNIVHVEPPENFAESVLNRISQEDIVSDDYIVNDNRAKKQKGGWHRWIGLVAGIMLAAFIGVSSYGIYNVQVADNSKEGFFNKFFILEPQPLQQKADDSKNQAGKEADLDLEKTEKESRKDEKRENNNKENLQNEKDTKNQGMLVADNSENVKNNDGQPPNEGSDSNNEEKNIDEKGTYEQNNKDLNNGGEVTIAAPSNITTKEVAFNSLNNISEPIWLNNKEFAFVAKTEEGYTWYKAAEGEDNLNRLIGPASVVGILSPDQDMIAFVANDSNDISCIWVMDKDGNVKNITPAGDVEKGAKWAYNPTWSVRNEIAYLSEGNGNKDLMITDLRGNIRNLTSSEENEAFPVWSPDGRKVAYYSYRIDESGNQKGQVFVHDISNNEKKAVTPELLSESMVPAWSPDGKLLAVSVKGSENGIWEVKADGSGWKKISKFGGGQMISWAPDGESIAYTDLNGKLYIKRRKAALHQEKLLTLPYEGISADATVSWSPDGTRLLYEVVDPTTLKSKIYIATLPKSINAY